MLELAILYYYFQYGNFKYKPNEQIQQKGNSSVLKKKNII